MSPCEQVDIIHVIVYASYVLIRLIFNALDTCFVFHLISCEIYSISQWFFFRLMCISAFCNFDEKKQILCLLQIPHSNDCFHNT